MLDAQTQWRGDVRVRAPGFAGATGWLNTDRPLSTHDLAGQVVLLDFWTYCCINCMHVLPDLKYLEDKYRDQPLVVIGVHSGKFSQEKDPENIRQAIRRHNVSHPVVVDGDYKIWNSYSVRAWPTLVLIDPEGYVVSTLSGEGHRQTLDRAIGGLVEEHRRKGTLGTPLRLKREPEESDPAGLAFPGKVLADAVGGRLFISDTNHHRVLIAALDGQVRDVVGSGEIGLKDGGFDRAQFHQPQGLALSRDGRKLYVADTENHALRVIDLEARSVETLAGSGRQARTVRRGSQPGKNTDLSSPWDLALVGDDLFIAMAGTHQIWVYDLRSGRVRVFAGTGQEAGLDGPHERAAFAQPSGLTSDGGRLYVADAEISSIRSLDTSPRGQTRTLAGSGELFDFGHRDGAGKEARFQHPLGVAVWHDRLFVADTFNYLIREVELGSGRVTTWLGTGRPEPGTVTAIGFFEPGGLSVAGDTLYVADTNHHRIVAVDIATRQTRVLNIRLPGGPQTADSVPH
jgi:sugar lactone lactonase YvrE